MSFYVLMTFFTILWIVTCSIYNSIRNAFLVSKRSSEVEDRSQIISESSHSSDFSGKGIYIYSNNF